MTTVAKLVARSLRLIQVIDAVQPAKPQDMETAIEALNGMMVRLEADGIAQGWSPVANPSDELPLPDEAETPIAYLLAKQLAPEFGVMPSLLVLEGAAQGESALLRDQMVATPIRPIIAVPVPDRDKTHSGGLVAGGLVG